MLITVTRIIQGIDEIISTSLIKRLSIFPPKYPLTVPTRTPIEVDITIAKIPTKRETLPP